MSDGGARRVSRAREVAAEVLTRVLAEDAFAAPLLDAALQRAPIDTRDAALATELVYGVLRTEGALDEVLATLAGKAGYAKDPRVRAHLLMAAYSLAYLDRVPAFAAVSEAVEGVRATGDARAAGFANAVLRKLSSADPRPVPSMKDAIVASAPGWLRGGLRRSLGRSGAADFLAALPVPPPIGLCLAKGEDRDAWLARLRGAAPVAAFEAGHASPRAILVRGAGDVRRLPGCAAAWIVMEEGAQAVALAAGARLGDRVLDACAGHGNKTWILADEVAPAGAVDAADLHPQKLANLRSGPPGARVRSTFAVDWTSHEPNDLPRDYDVVVVDAPCSGVGTLRRRPEIARRREEGDLARLSSLQLAITRAAALRVRDGGRLVYAVCSVLREEAEDVVDRLLAAPDEALRLEPTPLAGGVAVSRRLLPHVEGTDGYFVACFTAHRVQQPS